MELFPIPDGTKEATDDTPAITGSNLSKRAEKITFLVRMIACLSFVDPQYADLLTTVVPAKILAGQQPLRTNDFLQALAQASHFPSQAVRAAEMRVLEKGEVNIYSQSIKRRGSISKIQANVRGYLTRKNLKARGLMAKKRPSGSNINAGTRKKSLVHNTSRSSVSMRASGLESPVLRVPSSEDMMYGRPPTSTDEVTQWGERDDPKPGSAASLQIQVGNGLKPKCRREKLSGDWLVSMSRDTPFPSCKRKQRRRQ